MIKLCALTFPALRSILWHIPSTSQTATLDHVWSLVTENQERRQNVLKQEGMYCRMEGCNGKAAPRNQIGMDKTIHFDCEHGHKFHTDILKVKEKPCNCK